MWHNLTSATTHEWRNPPPASYQCRKLRKNLKYQHVFCKAINSSTISPSRFFKNFRGDSKPTLYYTHPLYRIVYYNTLWYITWQLYRHYINQIVNSQNIPQWAVECPLWVFWRKWTVFWKRLTVPVDPLPGVSVPLVCQVGVVHAVHHGSLTYGYDYQIALSKLYKWYVQQLTLCRVRFITIFPTIDLVFDGSKSSMRA